MDSTHLDFLHHSPEHRSPMFAFSIICHQARFQVDGRTVSPICTTGPSLIIRWFLKGPLFLRCLYSAITQTGLYIL